MVKGNSLCVTVRHIALNGLQNVFSLLFHCCCYIKKSQLFVAWSLLRFAHQRDKIGAVGICSTKSNKIFRKTFSRPLMKIFAFSLFLCDRSSLFENYWNWSFFHFHPCQKPLNNPLFRYVEKWPNILSKSCGVQTTRFSKYVWPFFNIMK